jgi:regulator of replication initiation timing
VLEDELDNSHNSLASAQKKLNQSRVKMARLVQEKVTLQKQVDRIPGRLKLAKENAIHSIQQKAASVSMKIKGVFKEECKRLYRQLLDCGVATTEVDGVIHNVAGVLGSL